MKPRLYTAQLVIVTALSLTISTYAFDCSFQASGIDYDLRALGGLKTSSKENSTPPTTSEAKVYLDLCGDSGIPKEDDVADEDQCGDKTKVCLKLLNHKPSASDPDRVTAVIPLWAIDTPDNDVRITTIGQNGKDGLKIDVQSAEYAGMRQTLNLTLRCDTSAAESNPSFISYSGNSLSLEWATQEACPRSGDDAVPPSSDSGSGFGFFGFLKFLFWVGLIGLIAYFAIGAFYNRQQYSAQGWDMIPHRDFWREFPVLVQDLFSHVVAGMRGQSGGGGRGGYSSLG